MNSSTDQTPPAAARITVTINGAATELPMGSTIADVVTHAGASSRGTAVARNAEVVPRSTWGDVTVADGDRIELLVAAQGG